MNIEDYTEIAVDSKYAREIFDIKYRLNANNITRLKSGDKSQAKSLAEMTSNYGTMSRT